MRTRQWILSLVLFLVSSSFLIFSKYLFAPPVPTAFAGLATTSSVQCKTVLLPNREYFPALKEAFHNARHSIRGTIFLVKTSPYRENEPAELIRELIDARMRNVDVELVIDTSSDMSEDGEANRETYDKLAKAGIKVRMDSPNVSTHAKTFVIDGRYCFIGSHNLTHSAMAINEELSVFMDSPEIGAKIADFVHQIPVAEPNAKR